MGFVASKNAQVLTNTLGASNSVHQQQNSIVVSLKRLGKSAKSVRKMKEKDDESEDNSTLIPGNKFKLKCRFASYIIVKF